MPQCATDTEHASFENAKETPMVSDEEVIQIVQSYPAERRYALAAMHRICSMPSTISPRRGFIAWLST